MKEVLQAIAGKYLFESFAPLDSALLQTRKKVSIFQGIDRNRYYHAVFRIEQNSRVGVKYIQEIILLEKKLVVHMEHQYKYKHMIIKAPLCSKAEALLTSQSWKVYR